MDLYANTSWGIQFPESVEYSISDDNVTFTSLGVVEADESRYTEGNEGWEYWTMDLDLTESASARYVKITAKAGNYVWSSEIEVLADLSGGSDEDPAEEPDEDPDDETPQTSDNILFLIAVLTVSLSGAVVITRKKRSA